MSLTKLNILIVTLFSFIVMQTTTELSLVENVFSSLNVSNDKKEQQRSADKSIDPAKLEQIKLKKLTYIAEYFGINTEGKSIDDLRAEVEKAKQENPEKWALLKKELHDRKIKMLEEKSNKPIK